MGERSERRDVVLIVVDCLRADRLLGPSRTCRTPRLDALATRATCLTSVFAENSLTTPSFASLLTGLHQAHHGVLGMVGARLVDGPPTLAEVFTAAGYHTVAEVTGPLHPLIGLDRGFVEYRFRPHRDYHFTGWGVELMARLRDPGRARPLFLLLHLWELHVPRQVPPAFDAPAFGSTSYDRALSALDSFLGEVAEAAGPQAVVIVTGDHGECLGEEPAPGTLLPYFLQSLGVQDELELPDDFIDDAAELVAREPALHRMARAFSELRESRVSWRQRLPLLEGLLRTGVTRYRIQLAKGWRRAFSQGAAQKRTDLELLRAIARGDRAAAQRLLVRTSLVEHRRQHGFHVYDYLQRVGMLLCGQGIFPAGRQVATQLRLIDLMPTLVEALALPLPRASCDGLSFYPEIDLEGADRDVLLEARGAVPDESIFLIRGLRTQGRKIVFAPNEPAAPVELYNVKEDPGETCNLAPTRDAEASAMRSAAESVIAFLAARDPGLTGQDANAEMLRNLKSLGYL